MFKKNIILFIVIIILVFVLFIIKGLNSNYTINEIYETRSKIVFKTSSIEVDNILLPYVKEFLDDAIRYNINIDSLSRDFMGIYYDYTPYKLVGIVFKKTPTRASYSLVSPLLETFINKLRIIVFHELSHYYLNRKHCHRFCSEIMSNIANASSIYNNFEEQKKVMFENLPHEPFKK